MKRYFFLDQSDYFTHFLDLASVELKRPSKEVSLTKLQSLMDLVLRNPSSVTVNDAFKEDLKVDMSHLSLVDQLLRIINVGGLVQGQGQGQTKGKGPGMPERIDSRYSTLSKDSRARTHSRANSGGTQYQQGSNDSWQEELASVMGSVSAMEGVMAASQELPAPSKGNLSGTLDFDSASCSRL